MKRFLPSRLRGSGARAALLAVLGWAGITRGAGPSDPPTEDPPVGGELRPASPPGQGGRLVLDGLLFLPRALIEGAVLASTATASFIEDQQIVPRVRDILGTEDGTLRWAPTFTVTSRFQPDVGARLMARVGPFSSMLRASVVNEDAFLSEGRLLRSLGERWRTQLFVEGFQQRNRYLSFSGLGPDPAHDLRNEFLAGQSGGSAMFQEERVRLILGASSRVSDDNELLFSSSLQVRHIEDPDGERRTLSRTFVPGSVAGAYDRSVRVYTEGAVRRDTRAVRGPPADGYLIEAYAGASDDPRGDYAQAVHAGGRVAFFLPVVRKTSILNPGFTVDTIGPFGGQGLPFREYLQAAGFRGSDGRVDRVAALGSLDYRWQLRSYVAARLFFDVTTVAPRFASLRPDHLAWALGGGLDLHSSTTELGRIGLAYSDSSIQFILSYGLSSRGFGDRQHR
jgi:hypothetical protein